MSLKLFSLIIPYYWK